MHDDLTMNTVDRDGALAETAGRLGETRAGFLAKSAVAGGGLVGGGAVLGLLAPAALAQEQEGEAPASDTDIANFALTLEFLETAGVPVLGWRHPDFPAFYVRSSGLPVPHVVQTAEEVALVLRARSRPQTGVLLTVPIPAADELDPARHDAALTAALDAAARAGITGASVTPYVLERVGRETEGGSVPANLALAEHNARVAAEVAAALVAVNA